MSMFKRKLFAAALCCIGVGIVLIIIAAGYYKDHRETDSTRLYNYTNEIKDTESLKVDIDYGKITIKTGDTFQVTADNITENGIISELKNDCWIIKDSHDKKHISKIFSFFANGDFNVEAKSPEIVITVPKDFAAKELTLHVGAGHLSANELKAQKAQIQIGAGEIEIEELTVNDLTEFEAGTGKINVTSLTAERADLDCGMGSINLHGKVASDIEAECGVGEIILTLSGNEEDYNYDVDCGIGSVKINQNTYGGTTHQKINNNAANNIELDCGVGSITITIEN